MVVSLSRLRLLLLAVLASPSVVCALPGTIDPSYGSGGRVMTPFPGVQINVGDLVRQPDGKLVVAGTSSNDFEVARYEATGGLDPTFGVGGIAQPGFAPHDTCNAVVLQPDGRIVAAGDELFADSGFTLVRYQADGSLDGSFGNGGVSRPGPARGRLRGLTLLPTGSSSSPATNASRRATTGCS